MKKNSVMVKSMFMSIITAGIISCGFSSCSKDDDLTNEGMNPEMESEFSGPSLESYGLNFQDFINEGDVQILDADTTQIAVSKAFADKIGIESFAGHPMGIRQGMEEDAYMCKATRQKLVGDRYIIDVAPCSLAELLKGQQMRLSSDLYVNMDPEQTRTRAAELNIPEYSAKFVDDDNVIHPISVTYRPAKGENATRSSLIAYGTFSTEDILLARQGGNSRWWPYDQIKDLGNKIVKGIKEAYDWTKDNTTYNVREYHRGNSLIQDNTTFTKKIEFGPRPKKKGEKVDTFNVTVKLPVDFALTYDFILDAKGSLVSLPDVNRFETTIAGTFDFAPQVTIGFSKKFEIPEDKQRLKIAEFPSVSLHFTVGIIPVTISIDPYVFLKFEGEVSGSAYTGLKYHYASHFKFGCAYTNGWSFIKEYVTDDNSLTMIPPTAEFKAHAGIGLMLGADVIVQKLAGPKLALGPKLTADAELRLNQDVDQCHFKSSVDVGFVGEIGAKLKIWKWELGEISKDFVLGDSYNIFHYNFPHEEGDTENGSLDNVMKLLMPFKQ